MCSYVDASPTCKTCVPIRNGVCATIFDYVWRISSVSTEKCLSNSTFLCAFSLHMLVGELTIFMICYLKFLLNRACDGWTMAVADVGVEITSPSLPISSSIFFCVSFSFSLHFEINLFISQVIPALSLALSLLPSVSVSCSSFTLMLTANQQDDIHF